ncbi:MAG: LON peptidase substrate-binding domain-containing protein [Gammaproteobacteria bacterium]|jgi:Lon protease-like protein
MTDGDIPLFPLRTVLYPDGPLPLRIFETRYLDMVSRCLREESGFGVVLIREGTETGDATTYATGTLARIVDWYQGSDGLLGVTARGGERFRLESVRQAPDGLNLARVSFLDPEPAVALPADFRPMVDILRGVLDDLGRLYEGLDRRYDDASWVGYRFAEILPIPPDQKQFCLETEDALQRLELIRVILRDARESEGED